MVVHGWIMKGEEKLSKSKGITLDPDEMAESYGIDPVRYYFSSEITFGRDGIVYGQAMFPGYNCDLAMISEILFPDRWL